MKNCSARNSGAAGQPNKMGFPFRHYLSAIREFPSVRFSQYQNAFDLVQTQFFNIMQNVNTPSLWSDPTTLSTALASWTSQIRTNTLMTAVSPAYRFYTAAGYEHGVLQYVPPNTIPGFCSDVFSTETSGTNRGSSVPLTDWASDMFNFTGRLRNTGDWVNATCLPNCDVPPVCPVTPIS
jgi:hypothetical protein